MDTQRCEHAQWSDDTQPYEETRMYKCNDCGLFVGSDEPNPDYDPVAAAQSDRHDVDVALARLARKKADEATP